MTMFRNRMRWALGVMASLASAPVLAQDGGAPTAMGERGGTTHQMTGLGPISVHGGMDIVSEYWFRGIFQENQGFIGQPWLTIGLNVYTDEEAHCLNSIDLTVGTWNSVHSGPSGEDAPPGATHDPDSWYENDIYAGVSLTLFQDWTLGVTWTGYFSPNDVFSATHEVAVSVGYDDSSWWGDSGFSLSPGVLVAFEFDGGADGISGEGVYLQLSLTPSMVVLHSQTYPVTLSLPMVLGLGLDDYYQAVTTGGAIDDETYGFFDIGLEASVPLAFIPSDFGEWEFHVGVHGIFTGSNNREDNGNRESVYAKFGFSFSF